MIEKIIKKKNKGGQFKIQQMAFMILAVFLFFILIGLGFLSFQTKSLQGNYQNLQRDQAISSLQVLTDMPELSCGYLCLDEDKLRVMSRKSEQYSQFWPVASVKVYKVYPSFESVIKCPSVDCNYFEIYDSKQQNNQEYSTYISLCKRVKENDNIYNKCEIGKLVVGVKINDE